MTNVISFPAKVPQTAQQFEDFFSELIETGLIPHMMSANNGVVSLLFEIEGAAYDSPLTLSIIKRTTTLFEKNTVFRDGFFHAVAAYSGVLQEIGLPEPRIDLGRTHNDVRRDHNLPEIH